jgi:hypothetical protein
MGNMYLQDVTLAKNHSRDWAMAQDACAVYLLFCDHATAQKKASFPVAVENNNTLRNVL